MPEFSPNDYFLKEFQKSLNQVNGATVADTKYFDLEQASREKLAEFGARAEAAYQADLAQKERDKQSWAGHFDPDSVGGRLLNSYAAYTYGAGRLAGHFVTQPINLASELNTQGLTQDDVDAFNAYQTGTATPEQMTRLTSKRALAGDPNQRPVPLPEDEHAREAQLARENLSKLYQQRNQGKHTEVVPLAQFHKADNLRQFARDINTGFDFSGIVHQGSRVKFDRELSAAFEAHGSKITEGSIGEKLDGLLKLLGAAGSAAVNNKQAVLEYVAENTPQILLAARGGGAGSLKRGVALSNLGIANLGYALDTYQQGIEKYQKENNGQLPSLEQRDSMGRWAISTAIAEHGGDLVSGGSLRTLNAALKPLEKAAKEVTTQSARDLFKAALKAPVGFVEGYLAEGATEGYQTFAEGKANLQGSTPEDIYKSFAIGGAVGGSMRGGPLVPATIIETARASAGAKRDIKQGAKERSINALVKEGNVDELSNPQSKSYAPHRAVGVLFAQTNKEPEKGTENLEKADQIIEGLETRQAALEEGLQTTEELQAALEKDKAIYERIKDNPDPRFVDVAQRLAESMEERQKRIDNPLSDKQKKDLQDQLKATQDQLEVAGKYRAALDSLVHPTQGVQEEVNSLVEQVQQPNTGEDTSAADRLITLAMENHDRLDDETIQRLVDDSSNGLSAQHRDALRALSAARVASNALKDAEDVSKEVLYGSKENVGIEQYKERFQRALKANQTKEMARQVEGISKFAQNHVGKLAAMEQAQPGDQIQRTSDGSWIHVNEPDQMLSPKQLKDNGGLVYPNDGTDVHNANRFNKLKRQVTAERDALVAIRDSMEAAIQFKQQQEKKNNRNVQNVSQRENREKTVDQTAEVQATEEIGQGRTETVSTQPDRTSGNETGNARQSEQGVKAEPVLVEKPTEVGQEHVEAPTSESPTRVISDRASGSVLNTVHSESPESELGEDITPVKSAESTKAQTTETQENQENPSEAITEATTASDALVSPTPHEAAEAAPEGSEQDTEVSVEDEKTSPTPTLTVLDAGREHNKQFEGKKLGEIYQQMNRAAAWVTQKIAKVSNDLDLAMVRPLTSISNFLTQVKNKIISLSDDIFAYELSEEEEFALSTFMKTANKWKDSIEKDFIKGSLVNSKGNRLKPDQAYRDPIQDFVKEDGSVDENLVTAIAYGAFQWLIQAARKETNTEEDIYRMVGLEPNGRLPRKTWEYFKDIVSSENITFDSIGGLVVQALGLKVSPQAPKEYLPNLRAALGMHAVNLLEKQGLIELKSVSLNEINTMFGIGGFYIDNEITYSIISIPKNKQYELANNTARAIVDSQKKSNNILEKLFLGEQPINSASTKPQRFTQKKTHRTKRAVPKKLARILNAAQKTPHTVIASMMATYNTIGRGALLASAGWVNPEKVQYELRASTEARNNDLERQLDLMLDLVESHPEGQEFFITYDVWNNFRVGVNSRNLDIQNSKIHRFMFQRPDWVSDIDLRDDQQVLNYEMGLAQSLGIKIDQKSFAQNQKEFREIIFNDKHPMVRMARALFEANNNGTELTEVQKTYIGAFAAKEEGMQSLQGLVSLGEYINALDTDQLSFKTTLLVGVDGKTNGPMLSHLALGAGRNEVALMKILNRGGFYEEGSDTNFNTWYSKPRKEDLYQNLGNAIVRKTNVNSEGMKALQVITGQLTNKRKLTSAGRNLAKTPVTSFMFGSSLMRSYKTMKEAFIEAISTKIADIANNPQSPITRVQLIDAINYFIADVDLQIPRDTPIEALMEMKWQKSQLKALSYGFDSVMEKPVVGEWVDSVLIPGAMQKVFSSFMQRRDQFNANIQVSWWIYNLFYQAYEQQEIERLMDSGDISFTTNKDSKRVPRYGLNTEQETALKERIKSLLPVMHTAYSQEEGSMDPAVYMGKTDDVQGRESIHKVQTYFGEKTKSGRIQKTGNSRIIREVSPGVAGLPYSIHALDSTIMHESIDGTQTLNVHDEGGNSANNVIEVAQALNKATWNNLLNYSPNVEAHELFVNALMNIADRVNEMSVDVVFLEGLLNGMLPHKERTTFKKGLIQRVVRRSQKNLYEAERARLGTMRNMGVVDQYTWEGGQYTVTPLDRDQAQSMYDANEKRGKKLSKEQREALKKLDKLLDQKLTEQLAAEAKPEAAKVDSQQIEQDQVTKETNQTKPEERFGGKRGREGKSNKPGLVKFFNENPETTAKEVSDMLLRIGGLNGFQQMLLRAVIRVLNPNTPITYISSKNADDIEVNDDNRGAHGWTTVRPSTGEASIYIVGAEFQNSYVSYELLLHEMVHAALTQAIHSKSPELQEAIQELNDLMKQAKDFIRLNKLSVFNQAVSNLDEFVAYGLTSEGFQKNVLAKLAVQTKQGNKLINGLKEFVNKLAALLGFKDAGGLNTFLTNSAFLFREASESNNIQDDGVQSEAITLTMNSDWFNNAKAKFNALVDRFIKGNTSDRDTHEVLPRSTDLMKYLGLPDLPVRIGLHGLDSVYNHGITPTQMKQVLDELANPQMVMIWDRNAQGNMSLNFVTSLEDGNGSPYVVAVKPNQGSREGNNHWIATITPKSPKAILNQVRDGSVLYRGDGEIAGVTDQQLKEALAFAKREQGKTFRDRVQAMRTRDKLPDLVQKTLYPKDLNSGRDDVTTLAMEIQEEVDSYTTLEIYEALGNGSLPEAHNGHLRGLLSGIVDKLHGTLGSLQEAARQTEAGNPFAIWLKALETGKAPFAAQVLVSPLVSTAQEDFVAEQVEATVRAVLDDAQVTVSFAYKELDKLYQEAYEKLSAKDFYAGDWDTATPYEREIAQEKFDFIFKMELKGDRANYLSRFAALGLTNQEFKNLLGFESTATKTVETNSNNSIINRLTQWFNNIMDFIVQRATNTKPGQSADEKLNTLVGVLVDIEAKRRYKLVHKGITDNLVDAIDQKGKQVVDTVKDKIVDIADSGFFQNHSNNFVKATASMVRISAGGRADYFMDALSQLTNRMTEGRPGLIKGIMNNIHIPGQYYMSALRATKRNEQIRKEVIDSTAQTVRSVFANKGKDLTDQEKAAVSAVLLRSGAHHLLDTYSIQELRELITDPQKLADAITKHEAMLSGKHVGDYLYQAKALGYQKATGNNTSEVLMLNAHNIAHMYGTQHAMPQTEETMHAAEVLAPLIALYAIKYSHTTYKTALASVFEKEADRKEGNGLEFTLQLAKRLEQASLDKLFNGDPTQMMHGYLPEITNPYNQIAIADEEEGRHLLNQGYIKVSTLMQDPADDTPQRSLYVQKDGGMARWVSGVVSLTSLGTKGTKYHSGNLNQRTNAGRENASTNARILNSRTRLGRMSLKDGQAFDPTQVRDAYMAPVVNDQGVIVNWRYMMREHTRDRVLERDNSFDKLLGSLAGSIFDKPSSHDQNAEVMKALHEVYKNEFGKNPASFIEIGPNAKDPEMRELWRMLPEGTKGEVNSVWGETPLTVNRDALDILFGYRKLTAANTFKKANQERKQREELGLPTDLHSLETINAMQKMVVYAVEAVLTIQGQIKGQSYAQANLNARKAEAIVAKGERMWQELVAEAKDIIVIKSGIVLLGNIWSNITLLALNGVPLADMVKYHYIAIRAAMAYRKDTAELNRLTLLLATGHTQGKDAATLREITRLTNAINRNPVKELIDAGLMPTIVEDISQDENIYTYKNALTRKVDSLTSKLHPSVVTAGRVTYMTHDSGLYQMLNQTTQLSDFVARYTLYQHLTTKKGMSKEEAVQRAADSFVNYDYGMPKSLQYSDDMGLTWFTKYFLRIQMVLLQLFQEHPARVLSTIALGQYMHLGPTVLEGSAIQHVGNNPFGLGAGKFVQSLDDLATVSSAMALVK